MLMSKKTASGDVVHRRAPVAQAATQKLVEIFCAHIHTAYYESKLSIWSNRHGIYTTRPGLLDTMRALLEAGADPNALVCVYKVDGEDCYRLSDADPESESFSASRPDPTSRYSYEIHQLKHTIRKPIRHSSPLIDALYGNYREAVCML